MRTDGKRQMRIAALTALLLGCLAACAMGAAPFDEQRKAVEASVATQNEAAIGSLLEAGITEGKLSQAFSVSQKWFAQNIPQDPKTLLLAARVAEYGAHYPEAVAFYQQFLEKADVASTDSQAAVMSLYHLMIDVMRNDNNSAYYYMKTHAEGFMPHGSARQYNLWFLDRAREKGRWADMADFLGAVCRSVASADEMKALYTGYFHELVFKAGWDPGNAAEIRTGDKIAALSESVRHDDELRLLLKWRGSFWSYSTSIFTNVKPVPASPLKEEEALLERYPHYAAMVWGNLCAWSGCSMKYDKEAKIEIIKKCLPKLDPMDRYQLLRSLHRFVEGVVEGEELKMLNAARMPRKPGFKLVNNKTPKAQAEKEYRTLIADFDSPEPKIPFVYDRLVRTLAHTPSVWAEHLKRSTRRRKWIFFRAVSDTWHGRRDALSTTGYAPINLSWNSKHHPGKPVLRKILEGQVARGQVEPWIAYAWINGIKPAWVHYGKPIPEAKAFAERLLAMPGYGELPFSLRHAMRFVFREVRTPGEQAVLDSLDPKKISASVLALTKESDATTVVQAVDEAIAGMKSAPTRVGRAGYTQLAAVDSKVLADPRVIPRIMEFWHNPSVDTTAWGDEKLFYAITRSRKKNFGPLLQRHAAVIWMRALKTNHGIGYREMLKTADAMVETDPSAAATLARAGRHAVTVWDNPQRHKGELNALAGTLGRANQSMKLSVIAVDKSSPEYPLYKSQNEYVAGNHEAAWKLFEENVEQALLIHRKLSADYMMWILARLIDQRDEELQQQLVTALRTWRSESAAAFSKGQSITLDLLYGDIAMQRGMVKEAHGIYQSIRRNKSYEGVPERHTATLRQIRLERMTKNFDAALNTVNELVMQRVPEMWAPARYAKAEVYYDMEDYDEVREIVDAILMRYPSHEDAKILQGKVMVKAKDFMGGSELEIGSSAAQKTISPGEMLKVTLNDPSLAVSGGGTDIEVVVWTDSGDSELVLLSQFGDSKTKFRGKVQVELGRPDKNDKTLQVIGDDRIYYSYSERFRRSVGGMEEWQGGPLTVVSDATLMASARRLLSLAEQKAEDARLLAESIKGKVKLDTLDTVERERIEAEIAAKAEDRLRSVRVKPGNPIYIRVVDEDRSRTDGVDKVVVSVNSTSGDSVGQVVLKETGTHTGTFEATLPTTTAQAMVFASSTSAGLNPNMVISPTQHPAWRSAPGEKKGAAALTVDLNDNVELGELTISAKEPGAKLRKFVLRAGMNARDMTTVAAYPRNQIALAKPWHPSVVVMNDTDHHHVRNDRSVHDIREIEEHVQRGWIGQQWPQGIARNVAGPSAAMDKSIPAPVKWMRQQRWGTSHVIYRFRGYFHEPDEVTRRFRLELGKYQIPKRTHPSVNHPAQYMLAVDGRPITKKGGALEGELRLRPGVHRFEIWATGWNTSIGFGRSVRLLANLDDPDELTHCPDSFFEPERFPEGVLPHRNAAAAVTANGDATEFKVKFAPGSRARLLHLSFVDHEGPVAALNSLKLARPDGGRVLPVERDYAELNKNDTLEILTGDRVWIRYVDDRCVTKSKQKHERQLQVAFSDGKVRFADIEPRPGRNGEMAPYNEQILRFRHGEKLSVVVDDPDMDVSDKPDTVEIALSMRGGESRIFTATETGVSSGTFRVFVTPVERRDGGGEEIVAPPGSTITASYRDNENVRPGIASDRTAKIRHALFSDPELQLSHMEAHPAEAPRAEQLREGFDESPDGINRSTDVIVPRMVIKTELRDATGPGADDIELIQGRAGVVVVVAPHLELRALSTVSVFMQSDTGRKLAARRRRHAPDGDEPAPEFDITVPGTRIVSAGPGLGGIAHYRRPAFSVYSGQGALLSPSETAKLRDGSFVIPFTLIHGELAKDDMIPERYADEIVEHLTNGRSAPLDKKTRERTGRLIHYSNMKHPLVVSPGDKVYFGMRYVDRYGAPRWVTCSADTTTHAQMDVMAEGYRSENRSTGLGNRVFLRVLDLGRDVSDDADTLSVDISARSGASHPVTLNETEPHTGIFKGSFQLTIAEDADLPPEGHEDELRDVRTTGFPTAYGDHLTFTYTDAAGREVPPRSMSIGLGSDGTITPFTKRYGDREIATRTQFAMAEAYLEIAKRYRKIDKKRSDLGFQSAKLLLVGTIEQFDDAETRAHAEYLLGNLTYEEAQNTEDDFLREERYQAALARFQKVTGSYPDSTFASKAQFKKAVVYERLKQPDVAAQEYVKLAYRHPDSEHLAVALARLGTHFLRKASRDEKASKKLLARKDDKDAQYEGDLSLKRAMENYSRSARIFDRLLKRFPTHELAAKAGLMSGKAFMRSEQTHKALDQFKVVLNTKSYGDLQRAESMYWAGKCFNELRQYMAAYAIYMRCTDDFPETKWSSFCLSELAQPRFKDIDTELEVQRLKEGLK